MTSEVIEGLRGGVIVSCQAAAGAPLDDPSIIAALALSAAAGGARGFRINTRAHVAAVRAVSDLPIVGIHKASRQGSEVRITPSLADALGVVEAGASVVALDGTQRPRPGGDTLERIISELHGSGVPVMADISTREEAELAVQAGADLVATTLAGYTPYSAQLTASEPAFSLLEQIRGLPVPVVVEGRIWTPEHVVRAFDGGAFAVVIGAAITAPDQITRRFVEAALRSGA